MSWLHSMYTYWLADIIECFQFIINIREVRLLWCCCFIDSVVVVVVLLAVLLLLFYWQCCCCCFIDSAVAAVLLTVLLLLFYWQCCCCCLNWLFYYYVLMSICHRAIKCCLILIYWVWLWNYWRISSWNKPVLINEGNVSCSRKQLEPLVGFELTPDRHLLITGQGR